MHIPRFDADLFSPDVMANPFDAYRELRDLGPICEMSRYGLYAMGRHADVRQALIDWEAFSSAHGVALNDTCNRYMAGTAIASDPPQHHRFRGLLARPLAPKRLMEMQARLADLADARVRGCAGARVREVVGHGSFDAMAMLARHLPSTVISEMVGLPEEGRQRMMEWAAAGFNAMGATGVAQTDLAMPIMGEMVGYICDAKLPEQFREGSWAQALWHAVHQEELTNEEAQAILQGYVTPSLDTTIYTLGTILWLLATHPDQWERLKANPALITRCINEGLRFEGPARGFSRVTTRKITVGNYSLPAGSRVMTVLPAANRDERRYPEPDCFDITRDASDHVGFGAGIHRCVGANLAMMELTVMLQAVTRHVREIEVLSMTRTNSTMLRGFDHLEVRLN